MPPAGENTCIVCGTLPVCCARMCRADALYRMYRADALRQCIIPDVLRRCAASVYCSDALIYRVNVLPRLPYWKYSAGVLRRASVHAALCVPCGVRLLPQSLPLLPDSLTAAFPPHPSLPCQPPSALGNDVPFVPLRVFHVLLSLALSSSFQISTSERWVHQSSKTIMCRL